MTRRVFNIVTDERGQPISGVPVRIQLNVPTFVSGEQKEIVAWGIEVKTDENGRWEVELEPNDLMSDPNSYYKIIEYSHKRRKANEYLIRVPSTGYTEPIHITNLLITPPSVTPSPEAVLSIAADNNAQLKGDVRLLSGAGIELQQDNNAKTITIVNTGGGGGGGGSHNLLSDTHTDTEPTTVQRGMLIVGRLIAGIVKWAGLALGVAGKFLKSDGTDVVWDDVNWDEVQNKPSTFPPEPHQHVKSDITDFAHTHPLSELQQSGATTGQVPKWSGTQWQAGNVDWNEVTNKPSTFPPEPHNHQRSDIVDFFSTPFWSNIPDRPSTFPPEPHSHDAADIVSGRLSASRLPTSPTANRFLVVRNANSDPTYDAIQASDLPNHTHTKSDITDFAHAASHQAGGSDELIGNLNANARVGVMNAGTLVGTRRRLNFIAGTNVTINVADDATNEKVDVTISAVGGGGGGVGLDVYPKVLTPGSGWDDTTNAALWEIVTYTNTKQEVLRYRDNQSNQKWWEFVVLDAANFGGSFKIVWSSPVAAPEGGDAVVWEVSAGVVNAGGSVDPTLTTQTVIGTRDSNEGADIQKETTVTLSLSGVSNGSRIIVRIRRLGADTNDTLAGDVRLHKVVVD